jgi:hypothetical protein
MMHLVLIIDIDGDVDQSGLERLRSHLNLKKQGRSTDDWDQEFGYRIIEAASGQSASIGLWREFDESWNVSVHATGRPDPGSDQLAASEPSWLKALPRRDFKRR